MIDVITKFREKIYVFYYENKRDFAWRRDITPYSVVVSEIMLQQTQTSRVVHKFNEWMSKFPNFELLAKASTQEVLYAWQGLGYNRRALGLHDFAKRVVKECNGVVPKDPDTLRTFKSIGQNTAGSICAFAFNQPVSFIETNIRTVFIHEFFRNQQGIDDKQLLPLITLSLDKDNPREWYYALMDYGVFLKKELKVSNKASKHYSKQSTFIGSKRQMRGVVIKILSTVVAMPYDALERLVFAQLPDNRSNLLDALQELQKEGFLIQNVDEIKLV